MSSKHARVSILTLVIVLGGCTGGTTASDAPSTNVAVGTLSASTAPTTSPAGAPAASPRPSDNGGGGAQPTPGTIDPCSLITAGEASKLMGRKLGAGVSTTLDPDRVCTFKSGLTEVKLILAPPAPDRATAQAYWDAARAQVPSNLPVTDLTLFDRSAFGTGSAGGISISALFVIDGQNFFDLFCGFPACTQSASVGAAQLIAGRLP
jgi:hypothetical protein